MVEAQFNAQKQGGTATHHIHRDCLALMVEQEGAPVTKGSPHRVRHRVEEGIALVDHKVKHAELQVCVCVCVCVRVCVRVSAYQRA